MNDVEMATIAKDIDAVTDALAEVRVLKVASPQGCAMALALASATQVIRNGGSRDDYLNVVHAAWDRAQRIHGR